MTFGAKMFKSITVHYPIRGHSYLECDGDMSHVNQKRKAEVPADWVEAILNARKNPAPFNVINMTKLMFYRFTDGLKPHFRATCPVPI